MSLYTPLSFWLTGRQHIILSCGVTQPLWFHHIISGSRMCQQSLAGALSQHPAWRSMAVMGFTDNVNAVQEALWTAASLLPPLPLPTKKKWPWIRNGNLVRWANTFSVKHCVYIWALPIYCLRATVISSIEAKIIDSGFDFLSSNMIMVLLSGCLQMLIYCRLLRLEFNQRRAIDKPIGLSWDLFAL